MEQQVAQSDDPFFLYFSPVAVHEPITPSLAAAGTSGAGSYGDFIHDLDGSVGRLLDALEAMGIDDETVVIFTSDNGGEIPVERDTPQRLAERSGLAINGALRGDKHTIWEGGTRVPLIARMPAGAQARGCAVSDALVNLTDIFATIADLVGEGAELAGDVGPDSVSFLPALQVDGDEGRGLRTSSVTANVNGIIAIRSGEWKWIEGALPDGFQGVPPADEAKPQLYNLRDDPGETTDVSRQYPDIVERLRQELKAIRESN
jgi:arylsulfatase A-like enzyme